VVVLRKWRRVVDACMMIDNQKPFDPKISGPEDAGFCALGLGVYENFRAEHSPQIDDKIKDSIRCSWWPLLFILREIDQGRAGHGNVERLQPGAWTGIQQARTDRFGGTYLPEVSTLGSGEYPVTPKNVQARRRRSRPAPISSPASALVGSGMAVKVSDPETELMKAQPLFL
jgi:hypothetical protein